METEIVNYIKEAQKHGLSELEIKQNLLNAGWDAPVVEQSFAYVKAAEHKVGPNRDEDIKAGIALAKPTMTEKVLSPLQGAVHPQIAISEQHFQEPAKKRRIWLWILIPIILAALGAGGYYAYANYYFTPSKVWDKFSVLTKSDVYELDFKFSYSDRVKGLLSDSESDFSLGLEGNAYQNTADEDNPESSGKLKFNFTSSGTSISRDFEFILFNKNFFLNVGPLPDEFKAMFGDEDKNYEWLKFDLNTIEELSQMAQKEMDTADSEKLKEFQQELQSRLEPIWKDVDLVKMEKYLGKEKVGDVNTYHFQNSLDKAALAGAIDQSVDALIEAFKKLPDNQNKEITAEQRQAIRTFIQAMVDKYTVKEFETWIGTKDFRLHKVHYVSNFISLNTFEDESLQDSDFGDSLPALGSARASSRDARRLADTRQMASALELYFNDKNGYPAGDNGKPVDLSPMYIGKVPEAPQPADGVCSGWYNTYWYEPVGEPYFLDGKKLYKSYEYSFCLGEDIGGYEAGIAKLTPAGINGGLPCTDSVERCAPAGQANEGPTEEEIRQVVDKINFGAELRVDLTYSKYGQTKTLEAPGEYWDVINELKKMFEKSGGVLGAFIKNAYPQSN